MSLRGFHIFFITLVTLISFGVSAAVYEMGFSPTFATLVASFGLAVVVYGVWFIRKSRKLIL
jgi:hypothetical protein